MVQLVGSRSTCLARLPFFESPYINALNGEKQLLLHTA